MLSETLAVSYIYGVIVNSLLVEFVPSKRIRGPGMFQLVRNLETGSHTTPAGNLAPSNPIKTAQVLEQPPL